MEKFLESVERIALGVFGVLGVVCVVVYAAWLVSVWQAWH